jgi:putative hemin transport protein
MHSRNPAAHSPRQSDWSYDMSDPGVTATPCVNIDDIRQRYATLRSATRLRQRDAAHELWLTEAQLLNAHVGASDGPLRVKRLSGDFAQLIKALEVVGPLMALTRNESVVHEKTGPYLNASTSGHVGLVLGEQIDLRIFYQHWKLGYWVEDHGERGVTRSLQFYDGQGQAVHKIFERPATKSGEFEALAARWADADQTAAILEVALERKQPRYATDDQVDIDDFRFAWASMKDTHEFFGLLKKFELHRTQGLRLAGDDFARTVDNKAAHRVLKAASDQQLDIMIFVGNPGCIQIHTGPVKRIEMMGTWLNVLDPDFNLHLREDRIAQSWVVRKPTADGDVTSLELFDEDGETIAFIFGKRKPGIPEQQAWRDLVAIQCSTAATVHV